MLTQLNTDAKKTQNKTLHVSLLFVGPNKIDLTCNMLLLLSALIFLNDRSLYMWISASSRSFRHISTDFISRILTNSVQSAGLRVKPTLFTVTVPPVHSASVVPEKAPGSDPAVRVATVIVLSYSFARVALLEAGHFGPVHAPGAGLGDVYRSTVEPVFPAALDAVSERQDE